MSARERPARPGKKRRHHTDKPATKRLNPQQIKFLEALALDPRANQTKAAIAAGYSEKTATVIASRLMAEPHVKAAWDSIQAKRLAKFELTAEKVIGTLSQIAFGDRREVAEWGPDGLKVKDSGELWPEQALLIQAVSKQDTEWGMTLKVKFENRIEALKLLGKHLKLFLDKHELKLDLGNAHGEVIEFLQGLAENLDAGEQLRRELGLDDKS
ncbi:MAG: terminase small subunit [Anaerolineae bacterium]